MAESKLFRLNSLKEDCVTSQSLFNMYMDEVVLELNKKLMESGNVLKTNGITLGLVSKIKLDIVT